MIINCPLCYVTTHFEKLRTLKKNSKKIKFGTKSTHFEKKNAFPKWVKLGHINALWKKPKIIVCIAGFFFLV